MPVPDKMIVQVHQLNSEVMIISSPIRLGSGGSARFAKVATNHHALISGRRACNPRVNLMVRLWVRS